MRTPTGARVRSTPAPTTSPTAPRSPLSHPMTGPLPRNVPTAGRVTPVGRPTALFGAAAASALATAGTAATAATAAAAAPGAAAAAESAADGGGLFGYRLRRRQTRQWKRQRRLGRFRRRRRLSQLRRRSVDRPADVAAPGCALRPARPARVTAPVALNCRPLVGVRMAAHEHGYQPASLSTHPLTPASCLL